MHLARLDIKGFKSFASATTLALEPGITCVVGPNGSGKSNVVDALSWVMGEQGAKSLRGGKMEDVIFAGTKGKAPLGRAEVALTIDNADGALDIDYSEVTIKRTMFRSGGSEYSINGSAARLTDVTDLLSDAGIGREMHVIVGQNRLDAVLRATPFERRTFIEEAAGILKHRKRKEKALRKLDAVQTNTERLEDIFAEVSRTLAPLAKQARVAREAERITHDVRDAGLRLLADDIVSARTALAEVTGGGQAHTAALARVDADVEQARQAHSAAQQDLTETTRRARQAIDTARALHALTEQLQAAAALAAERGRLLAEPAPGHTGPLPAALRESAAQLEAESTKIQEQLHIAGADRDAAAAHVTRAESEVAALNEAQRAADKRTAEHARALAVAEADLSAASRRYDEACASVREAQQRMAAGEERVEQCAQRVRDSEQRVARVTAGEQELDAEYEAAAAAADEAEAALDRARAARAHDASELSAARARVEALSMALSTRREGIGELSFDESDVPDVLGVLSELLPPSQEYGDAIAAALGSLADAVVVSTGQGALEALAYAGRRGHEDLDLVIAHQPAPTAPALASAAPDESATSLAAVIVGQGRACEVARMILADVWLVPDDATAQRVTATATGIRCVTPAGRVWSNVAVTGSEATEPSTLHLRAIVDGAQSQVAELAARIDARDDDVARCEQAHRTVIAVRDDALASLHESDAALAAATGEAASATAALKQATGQRDQAAAAHARSQELIELAEIERQQAQLRLDELGERVIEAGPQPHDQERAVAGVDSARKRHQELTLHCHTLAASMQQARSKSESLARRADSEERLRAAAEQRAQRRAAAAQQAWRLESLATRAARIAASQAQSADKRVEHIEQHQRSATAGVEQLAQKVAKAQRRAQELREEQHQAALVAAGLSANLDTLTARAVDDFDLDADVVVRDYGPEVPVPIVVDGTATTEPYDRASQTARFKRAKRGLASLGKVNPLAIEEHAAAAERHDFLRGALDDLAATRSELLGLISSIDTRVQEVFTAAWEDTQREFSRVFSRLFPGGEGSLELEDPENVLTSGISVSARPAGKKVRRLSLLSGGERSLTAVAFLVAIFRARPSPFYVLDEVEAALDDANLGRLLVVLEELRDSSQLIVITHQKRTMEIADALYGVSMQGDGVSRVVSKRLRERVIDVTQERWPRDATSPSASLG